MDGAFSNLAVFTTKLSRAPPATLGSRIQCSNHRNHLIEVSIQGMCGSRLVPDMFTTSMFFRMGSHWVRMIVSLPGLLREPLAVQVSASVLTSPCARCNPLA